MERVRLKFDSAEGPEWVAQYHKGYYDFDDDLNNSEISEIIFNAPDFDTAVRYAQQYLRKQKSESDGWEQAQILSVELY